MRGYPLRGLLTGVSPHTPLNQAVANSFCNGLHVLPRFAPLATEVVELVVGPHDDQVGHAVGQREEGGDGADVPGVLVGEAVGAQRLEIGVADGLGARARPSSRSRASRFCRGVMSALR